MGYGVMRVSARKLVELLGEPAVRQFSFDERPGAAEMPYDPATEPPVHEQVRQVLLLPDGYRVRFLRLDLLRREYEILLEADALPDVPEGCLCPEVTPKYQMEPDGSRRLVRLDVEPTNLAMRTYHTHTWYADGTSEPLMTLRQWTEENARHGSLREVLINAACNHREVYHCLPEDNVACADELRAVIDVFFTTRAKPRARD